MLICINKIFKINVSVVRDVRQMFGLSSSLQSSWSVRVFVRNCSGLRLLCPGLVRRCTFEFPSKGVSSPRFQFWEKVSSLFLSILLCVGCNGVCTKDTVKISNVKWFACHVVCLVHANRFILRVVISRAFLQIEISR